MSKLLVEVTQEDIRKGKRKNPLCCPIAIALKRALTMRKTVCAGHEQISFEGKAGRRISIQTPSAASAFMALFDNYLAVSPFTFEIELPPSP